MVLLMTVAAAVCVLQLGVLGSWARSLRLSTLLLAIGVGFYACGTASVLFQLAWTRTLAALTGTPLSAVVATAAYTVDPLIEEVVKVLPLVVVAWRWRATHRQLGLTDHVLAGAALGVGFELFEAALRFSTLGLASGSTPGGYVVSAGLGGAITVQGLWTSLTSWQPAPVGLQGLLAADDDTVQHLVWTALAGLGVGWAARRTDALRWLGVTGVVLAYLDHANYNLRLTSVPFVLAWPSGRWPGSAGCSRVRS